MFTACRTAFCSARKDIDSIAKSVSYQIIKNLPSAKISVAVMPFENVEGKVTELGTMISETLSRELIASQKTILVERKDIGKIFQEWKLNTTGAINQASTKKIGEMTGADYMLIGSVQKISGREIMVFAKLIKTESAEIWGAANVPAKVDVETLALNRSVEQSEEAMDDAVVLSGNGPGKCTMIESRAVTRFGNDETKNQARARAIARARQKAMIAALGEEIPEGNFDYGSSAYKEHGQLIQDVLLTTRYGRISEENIVEEGVVDSRNCKGCLYRVLMRSCVSRPKGSSDKGFFVSLGINRMEFLEGDEASVTVNVSRDAYIYLLSVDKDWNAILAFPNDAAGDNFVKAYEPFRYPDQSHKKAGIHLVAELPKDEQFSAETVRILAVKKPIPKELWSDKYNTLLENLDNSGTDWTESAAAFTIRKK